MNEQPTALQIADRLRDGRGLELRREAEAELRRLHDLADKYKRQLRNTRSRAEKAEAQRDALLEALKSVEPILCRMYGAQANELPPMQVIRAAIKAAEGEA